LPIIIEPNSTDNYSINLNIENGLQINNNLVKKSAKEQFKGLPISLNICIQDISISTKNLLLIL
jgi:hypothetical protein